MRITESGKRRIRMDRFYLEQHEEMKHTYQRQRKCDYRPPDVCTSVTLDAGYCFNCKGGYGLSAPDDWMLG